MSLFEKNNPLSSPPVLTVLNGMQNGMLILNADMEILFWNNWVTENTGIDFTYGEGKAFKDVFPTANDKGLNRKVKSSLVVNGPVFCSSSSIGYLLQIPLKGVIDSSCKHMQQDWVIAPFDSDCVFIAIYDVTTTRESEFRMNRAYDDLNKLKQSLEQKVGLMDRYIPSLVLTPEGSIRNASEAFFLLCPQDADSDVADKRLDCFFKLSDIERELVNQVLSGERLSWEGKLTTSSIDDPICWVEVNLIRESTDVDSNITAIFRNITNEKYFEELSSIDKLTNSYNRQYFEQALLSQINSSERYETFFSLIVVDIDHFKDINDRYGHLIGDEVLIELSKIMRDSIRGCDTFARLGGEEFAVLLPQTDCRDAMIRAEKCCQMIANHQFKSVGKVTASFGVAEYSCAGKEELLKKADSALYEAKTSGRNCVKHWQN